MEYISNLDDANLCKRVLASIAIIYWPITLKELATLIEALKDITNDLELLREIISLCRLFLTMRDNTIYFMY